MWFHGVKSFLLIRCWWFELSNSFWVMHSKKKGSTAQALRRKIIIKRHTSKVPHEIFLHFMRFSREKIYHLHHKCMCAEFVYVFGPINSNKSKKFHACLDNKTNCYDLWTWKREISFCWRFFCEWKLTLKKWY